MTESPRPRRARKILVPLTTLLAAGALTIGSGANFTSQSENPNSIYATGTLKQSNSKANQAIFDASNLKPGDTVIGEVTIKNTGTLAASFTVVEAATNGFVIPSNLVMTVTKDGAAFWTGTFGTFGTKDLGTFAVDEAHTFKFTTQLKETAGNDEQGKSATATYTWNSVQTSPITVDQSASSAHVTAN